MKASVIVTSINNSHLAAHITMACLRDITLYTNPKDYELILVDPVCDNYNPPRDDYKVLKIDKWLKPDPDPGYAACVNLGAKEAKGDYLFFVQNDAFVNEGWLDGILKYLENGYDLVWPDQIPRTRADVLEIEKRDWFDEKSLHGWNDEGLFAISRKAWDLSGGYNPEFSLLVQKEFLGRIGGMDIKRVDINKVRYTHLMAGSNLTLMEDNPQEYERRMTKDAEVLNKEP